MNQEKLNPGYNKLHEQAFTRVVGKGINPKTGVENKAIEYYNEPVTRVESLYCTNTDGLIGVLDGSITSVDTTGERALIQYTEFDGEPADVAIYLDKSARPIRRLVHELWDYLASEDVPEPESHFLNIDKEIWLRRMGLSNFNLQDINPQDVDISKIDPDTLHNHITRLRSLFIEPHALASIDENNLDDVWNMPTVFDGKNIAIIDEVRSSGNTLRIALQLLQKAFPDAKLSCVYWSTPPLNRWQFMQDGDIKSSFNTTYVPVWYDEANASGRGIDDIDPLYSESSNSKVQRIGKFILSTPYHRRTTFERETDRASTLIRQDISLLARRIVAGKVFFRPSPHRKREDFRSRAAQYNHCTFEEFKRLAASQ